MPGQCVTASLRRTNHFGKKCPGHGMQADKKADFEMPSSQPNPMSDDGALIASGTDHLARGARRALGVDRE